jgi:predicted N-acetyltransferase YhbS
MRIKRSQLKGTRGKARANHFLQAVRCYIRKLERVARDETKIIWSHGDCVCLAISTAWHSALPSHVASS